MAVSLVSLESRLKENIKNYSLDQLLDLASLADYFEATSKTCQMSFLLVDRHGENAISIGNFSEEKPDVVANPGKKIRVENRTIAHLYVKEDELDTVEKKKLVETIVNQITLQAKNTYSYVETSIYADELEKMLEKEQYRVKHGEKMDALTGTLNSTYFDSRTKVIDRSEVVPVAVICANINDWKYADDHFGREESDRLIKTVAQIIKEEAKNEYVIARTGGDFFNILIPFAEDGEAEEYCERIQEKCNRFQDDKIAPSIACGIVYKTNVEQTISELLPDAEYEMFNNKLEVKNAPGYRERLEK